MGKKRRKADNRGGRRVDRSVSCPAARCYTIRRPAIMGGREHEQNRFPLLSCRSGGREAVRSGRFRIAPPPALRAGGGGLLVINGIKAACVLQAAIVCTRARMHERS